MLQQVLKFILLAIPLFVLAGELMNTSGITTRIFNFAHACFGHIRGGLGHVNVVGSMIFAGMSGSATADAAGLGRIEIKAMVEAGYRPQFAAAITCASSTIGPIIPPSIGLVLYGAIVANSLEEVVQLEAKLTNLPSVASQPALLRPSESLLMSYSVHFPTLVSLWHEPSDFAAAPRTFALWTATSARS